MIEKKKRNLPYSVWKPEEQKKKKNNDNSLKRQVGYYYNYKRKFKNTLKCKVLSSKDYIYINIILEFFFLAHWNKFKSLLLILIGVTVNYNYYLFSRIPDL